MKTAIKQLFAGFIYSLMAVSLILGPIPKTNVVWAAGEEAQDCYKDGDKESRVYKAGCDFDGIVDKTKMERYAKHQGDFMAFLEQAVAGMMAVVMIQSLRYDYRHSPNVGMLEGNDCSANKAGKYTIRIAQLGALSYIIGDIKANSTFQNAAKRATDEAFAMPTETPGGEDGYVDEDERKYHKNKTLRSFDTLIEIFEQQKKGLKSKIFLSLLAEGAFAASLGVELAGIGACTAACGTNLTALAGRLTAAQSSIAGAIAATQAAAKEWEAIAAASTVAAAVPAANAVACESASASLGTLQGAFAAKTGENTALDTAEGTKEAVEDVAETGFWAGVLAGVKGFFSGAGGAGAAGAEAAAGASEGVENVFKAAGVVAKKEEVEAVQEVAADTTKATEDAASHQTVITGVTTTGKLCLTPPGLAPVQPIIGYAVANYIDYFYSPVECCGSTAPHPKVQVAHLATRQALAATAMPLFATVQDEANLAKQKLQSLATEKLGDEIAEGAAKEAISGILGQATSLDALSGLGTAIDSLGSFAHVMKGTPPGMGIAMPGQFASAKDIKVIDLFSGVFSNNENSENYKYYVKKNFESLLRRVAVAAQIKDFDPKNPKTELIDIADLEQKLNQSMFFFERMIDDMSAKQLASNEFTEHELWPVVVNKVSEMIMPKANAFLANIAGAVGLQIVSKMVGKKGPWDELLNVGGQFMLMSAILGNFVKSWGLTSPKGRSYTFGTMAVVNGLVLAMDIKAKNKVQKYIDATKKEKKRYEESIGMAGVKDDPNASGSGAEGTLALRAGDARNSNFAASTGGKGIKSCAVPKGMGFAPAACPVKVPESKFRVPKPGREVQKGLVPAHFDSMGLVSKYSRGLASGELGTEDMANADIGKLIANNKAMRERNEKLMKMVDADERKKAMKMGLKEMPTPLSKMIAEAKKAIAGDAPAPNLASLATTPYRPEEKDEKKKEGPGVTTSSAFSGSGKTASIPKTNTDPFGNLGFENDGISRGDDMVEDRPEEKLEDYVVEHNDINKRKEVSIFKILSNRYLLSYPKIMEEKKKKSAQE